MVYSSPKDTRINYMGFTREQSYKIVQMVDAWKRTSFFNKIISDKNI